MVSAQLAPIEDKLPCGDSDPPQARAPMSARGVGNDEGFAWVDHAELGTGERLDPTALAARLIANGISVPKRMPWHKSLSDEQVVQEMLDFSLAVNWAAALLGGPGFG